MVGVLLHWSVMPKFRSVHTKIRQSFDFNDMPDDFTRLLWVLLPLALDCDGRGIYNSGWIKSNVFPIREDIEYQQITSAMEWFYSCKNPDTTLGMIEIYEINGRKYFYVPTFKEYQRGFEKEAPSILPSPVLVDNNSVTSQELVESKLPLNAHTQSNTQSESKENNGAHPIQIMIEQITGKPPSGFKDIKAMDEMEQAGVLQEDIQAGYKWYTDQGNTFNYYGSIVKPSITAMNKRIQEKQKHKTVADATKDEPEIDYKAMRKQIEEEKKARMNDSR